MNAKQLFAGVVCGWLATSNAASAQVQHLVSQAAFSQAVLGQQEAAQDRRTVDELLRQARAAMKQGNVPLATKLVERAEAMDVKSGGLLRGLGDSPEKVRRDLTKLSAALGTQPTPPVTAANMPVPLNSGQMIQNPYLAQPQDGVNLGAPLQYQAAPNQPLPVQAAAPQRPHPQVAECLRLMAQSKMQLDRGDVNSANVLAKQAYEMRIPDEAFGPNDPRPWMLVLEIERTVRQQAGATIANQPLADPGVAPAVYSTNGTANAYVQPAAALQPTGPVGQLAQAEPGSDDLGDPFAADDPSLPNVTGRPIENASELMQLGEDALRERDTERAKTLFQQAWQLESQLDPAARQRLQDHLQLLRTPPSTEDDDTPKLTAGEQQLVRRFVTEVGREQAAARRLLDEDPRKAWDRLKELRDQVADSELPETAREQLLVRINNSINETEEFIARNRVRIEQAEQNQAVTEQIDLDRVRQLEVSDELAKLVDEFNTLMDQERFAEAIMVSKKAEELGGDNEVIESMKWKSRFAQRFVTGMSIRERMEQGVVDALTDVDRAAIPWSEKNLMEFPEGGDPRYWRDLITRRERGLKAGERMPTETEIEIQRSLRKPVNVSFTETPLSQVVKQLSDLANISIYLDPKGMETEGVTSEMPVSINLNHEVQLRSALNLILEPFRLTYVVQDEVLKITSVGIRDQNVQVKTYQVADLVIPIPNFIPGADSGMAGALNEAFRMQRPNQPQNGNNNAAVPIPLTSNDTNGGLNAGVLAQFNNPNGVPPTGPGTEGYGWATGGPGGMGGAAQADFDTLIELITATIDPDSWDEFGGEGSIQEFPTNLSIVVSNTSEVHEQIADLLEQLRRLQDLQVTIEVRFITLNDNFFERIGVDFDFDIDDNVQTLPDDDSGPSVTVGLDPQGNPTADLDLAFTQDSFGAALPAFGGFDSARAANFGFAILSDIEAFFVIEAATGDNRTNVLQAPKVTLFNGQQATVSDTSQRPFVQSVTPVVGDFAAAQQPIIVILNEGTQLNVQAVVSPDRRFVRLTLVPFFSTIGDVDTFTFESTRRGTTFTGNGNGDPTDDNTTDDGVDDLVTGTTVQLPTFAFTSVSTTVSVPDGGTILLGGIKRLSEGRNETGVPMLSKLPYVNRLFKNVGIGRTTQSLMMMVTPRIIIQEEEEEKLGVALP